MTRWALCLHMRLLLALRPPRNRPCRTALGRRNKSPIEKVSAHPPGPSDYNAYKQSHHFLHSARDCQGAASFVRLKAPKLQGSLVSSPKVLGWWAIRFGNLGHLIAPCSVAKVRFDSKLGIAFETGLEIWARSPTSAPDRTRSPYQSRNIAQLCCEQRTFSFHVPRYNTKGNHMINSTETEKCSNETEQIQSKQPIDRNLHRVGPNLRKL